MRCTRCSVEGAIFPRQLGVLCGRCLLDDRGLTNTLENRFERYRRLMAEAQAEYDAWETVFLASLGDERAPMPYYRELP